MIRIFVQVFLLEFLQIVRSSCFENGAGLVSVLRFVLNFFSERVCTFHKLFESLPVGSLKN